MARKRSKRSINAKRRYEGSPLHRYNLARRAGRVGTGRRKHGKRRGRGKRKHAHRGHRGKRRHRNGKAATLHGARILMLDRRYREAKRAYHQAGNLLFAAKGGEG